MLGPTAVLDGPAALAVSSARVVAAVESGCLEAAVLAEATAIRMVAASTLAPAPRAPVEHVRAAHAAARRHLERFTAHDPAIEVTSTMTAGLFARLTQKPATAGDDARVRDDTPRAPAPVRHYTYTPRKVLRRVLDHALDHLNQIDQWLSWQHHGVTPIPTDGWASSIITLPEDRHSLSAADLDAWLWRIDQAARLLVQRAASLSDAELDWQPPDGGWPLRRVLHHVARSELLYAASLDDALPEDPRVRYAEARRRLSERFRAARERGADDSIVYVNLYGALYTPDEAIDEVLSIENALLRSTA